MRVRRLDPFHDMTFGQGQSNIAIEEEAISQKVETRLLLLKGEWFLDVEAGVPYISGTGQHIEGVKPVDLAFASATLKATILETEGVTAITAFAMNLNTVTRRLKVEATVENVYGTNAKVRVVL